MAKGPDTDGGSRDAVQPKDLSKGEQSEKGDAHREYRHHQGKTRGHTTDNNQSDNGTNAGSDAGSK